MAKVLVAYATKTGTTKEIAQEIARALQAEGLDAEARGIGSVEGLEGWSAVIVGAPINGMSWLPEALGFVRDHASALRSLPTAYFLVSYLLFQGGGFWKARIRAALDRVSAIAPPVGLGMFGGRLPAPLPTAARVLFGVRKGAPLDLVNPEAARAWARQLAPRLARVGS